MLLSGMSVWLEVVWSLWLLCLICS